MHRETDRHLCSLSHAPTAGLARHHRIILGPGVRWLILSQSREHLGYPCCSAGKQRCQEFKHVIPLPPPLYILFTATVNRARPVWVQPIPTYVSGFLPIPIYLDIHIGHQTDPDIFPKLKICQSSVKMPKYANMLV